MRSTQDISGFSSYDEESVLEQVKKGDSAAFNILADEYESVIAAKASLARTKGVEFEDILQEGYMALFNAARTYSPDAGASFKTYATVCISNRIASVERNHGSSKNRPLHDYSELSDDSLTADLNYEPEFAVLSRERIDVIFKNISILLSDTESRVLMFYLSGKSYAVIAEELNMTEKAVDNALQRARRKLKTALDEQQ